jgi:hypothetical protein
LTSSFQRWTAAHAILVHYGKTTWQPFNKHSLGQKPLQHNDYFGSCQSDISRKRNVMTARSQRADCRPRLASIRNRMRD